MKKISALFLVFVIVLISLTSCGYEISIKKKGEGEGEVKTTTIVLDENYPADDGPFVLPDVPTTAQRPANSGGFQVDTSYQAMAMSA